MKPNTAQDDDVKAGGENLEEDINEMIPEDAKYVLNEEATDNEGYTL